MGLLDRLFRKKKVAHPVRRADAPPPRRTASGPSAVAPKCSLCARQLEALNPMARYSAVIGAPDATLYRGVVCTQCHSVICLDCQDPADQPCKACGGKVLPATGDVIPSTTTTSYLYLLQKSRQPTEALMRTVLKWWRQQHGQNFQMLGGRKVDSIPATADVYIV